MKYLVVVTPPSIYHIDATLFQALMDQERTPQIWLDLFKPSWHLGIYKYVQ